MARTKTAPAKFEKGDSDQDNSDSEQDHSEDDQTNATSRGCFPRGTGGKRVPSDYSEEPAVKLETSEIELVHSESDKAKAKAGLLYHVRDNSKYRNVLAKIVTLRKDNPQDKFIMKSIEDNKIIHARTIWFKGGCFPRGMGGKRVPSDYSEDRMVKSESGMVHSESDRAKVKAGYKTPTKRRRVSQDEDNSEQEEDHAKPGVGAQSKRRLLYHVRDNSKYRYVRAEIVKLRKDNPQNQFIMKSTVDNKIICAGTIWFKGGCFPRGMGGKRVPSDYSEEQVVKPETSESGLVHSESDRAKVKSGYKTPTKGRRVSQDEDNSEQEEDHAKPGVGAQPKRRLLYHVHDNSKKRNVLAEIVTLRKDNPQDKFIMKSIEDNKIIHARTIWFKGGCFPRGMGGKRVPNDYSEERVVKPETSENGLVHSESGRAKVKAEYIIPPKIRRSSHDKDDSTQEDDQTKVGAEAQFKIGEVSVPLLKLEPKDHEGDPQACSSKDQGYETPTENRRGSQDEDDSADEDDRAKREADMVYVY
ncbi:ABC transporter F family member 4-like isoform X1 [Ptychodera flava]|uniref:ABC transporter F family member 4-like isoform X1 n=1 Tax=Ptychodera flava TaxID=63121 RepID=UPI00396A42B5